MIGALITFGLIGFSSFFIQIAHNKFESYRNAHEKPEMEKLGITDRKQLPADFRKESMKKGRNACSNRLAKAAGLLFWLSLLGLAILGFYGDQLFKGASGCFL